jgi:glutamate racemase
MVMPRGHADRPIAIFDSGLGGLTVAAAIHRRLPTENLLFLADRARVPYASLSIALIERFAVECFDFLLAHDPKAVVIACNTVSSVCLKELEDRSPVPVIGVIEPTALGAIENTGSGRIGVIATSATVRRQAYETSLKRLRADVEVTSTGCPLFVPLVEEGWTQGDIPRQIVAHYLASIRCKDVDTLVMGCTHYEYFRSLIQEELGDQVTLINTPEIVAQELKNILLVRREQIPSAKAGYVRIYSTDISETLDRVVSDLFPEQEFPNQVTIQSAQIPPRAAKGGGQKT